MDLYTIGLQMREIPTAFGCPKIQRILPDLPP
jgi:hypothetical protein